MGFLDKVKNMFTEEVEEPVKSQVIQVEIPAPVKKEEVKENISDSQAVKKEEKTVPIFFDDEYFKELEKPKQEIKSSYMKETKKEDKRFKPTPIISPVYGVLDKNYNKEDITVKQERQSNTNITITIDEVRKKAFGTLEDDIETTMFNNSILFSDEIDSSQKDLFDEIEEVKDENEDLLDDLVEDILIDDNIDVDDENIVLDEMDKDDIITSSELFNLIDSMYEKED